MTQPDRSTSPMPVLSGPAPAARLALRIARLALAALTLFAIGRQLGIHVAMGANVLNFFSYFTNLSNLIAALVFLLLGLARDGDAPPAWLKRLRAISVVNMVVVGIVFSVLLRNVDLGALLPWVNFVLHTLMPIAVALDWLAWPQRASLPGAGIRMGWRDVLWCLPFPALYLVYSVVRGASTGWFAYPFLNPAKVGGAGGVAVYALGITATFIAVAWLLFAINARRTEQPETP